MSKLSEIKQKNEVIQRRYLRYKQGADGFSTKSILAVEKAIWKYKEFSKNEDYSLFNDRRAEQFKKYISTTINKKSKKPLGLKSQYHHLRHLREFFSWLSDQPGYKSKISASDARYLQLSKKDRQIATAPSEPKYPTLSQIKQLCSFPINNDIDQRDRALIALTALTGIRDQALATLSIRCFDPEQLLVKQWPSLGVQTKFSKDINTTIYTIDNQLLGYFTDWYQYLVREKSFGNNDPLFPCTQVAQTGPNNFAFESKGVSKKFWSDAGPIRQIFKNRAEQTKSEYFYPHTFRHFVTNKVEKHITTPEQMKALSQNLGHEQIITTFRTYGGISVRRVNEVVRSMDFSEQKPPIDQKTIEAIADLINKSRSN